MSDLYISSTIHTPEVSLSVDERVLSIYGVSRSTDAHKLYVKILDNIVSHRENLSDGILCNFHFENIINVNSLKMIIQIINKLKSFVENKDKVIIVWNYYSDEQEIKETGDMLSQMLDLPFKIRMLKRAGVIRKEYHIQYLRLRPFLMEN
jgi:hypothetical protein